MPFRTPGLNPRERPRRKKFNYVGAPKIFALELACSHLWRGFCSSAKCGGCYIVGSALQRPDWRDVDVVCILDDAAFAALFPDAADHFEGDQRWLVLTVALSHWLSAQSGLPIDFKFQPMKHANSAHSWPRDPIGLCDLRFKK